MPYTFNPFTGNFDYYASGGGSPGGSDGQVQFNDSGSFGGGPTWDKTNIRLGIGTTSPQDSLHIYDASTAAARIETATDAASAGFQFKKPSGFWIIGNGVGDASQDFNISAGTVVFRLTPGGSLCVSGGTSLTTARVNVVTDSAGLIGQIIRGASAQTANLLELQNSSGTALTWFSAGGNLYSSNASLGINSTGGNIQIQSLAGYGTDIIGNPINCYSTYNGLYNLRVDNSYGNVPNAIGFIVKGAISQAVNLIELQNSSGTVLTQFTTAGNLKSGARTFNFIGGNADPEWLFNGQGSGNRCVQIDGLVSPSQSTLFFITMNGNEDVFRVEPSGASLFKPRDAAVTPLTVRGTTSQAAKLQRWADVSDVTLSYVYKDGQIGTVNGDATVCGFHFRDQPSMGIVRNGGTAMTFYAGDTQKVVSVSSDPTDYGLFMGESGSGAPLTNQYLRSTNGSGTNIAGSNLIIAGGKSTGSAVGGWVLFQTPTIGSSGTTLQSYATRLTVDNTGVLISGKLELTTVTKTANYTAANEYAIRCDATGGAFTITLPVAASSVGRIYSIKKIDSSANAITVDGNASETIDGQTTQILSAQYDAITIMCDGTTWDIQ